MFAPLHDAATHRAVMQSRFGFYLNEPGHFRGHVEIDFYDATKASPTVTSNPRLRIITADWIPSEHFWLSIGQDWDLHAPVNPYTINIVGLFFEGGNTAFMRQQVKAVVTTKHVELGVAVGIQAPNGTPTDNAIEIGHFPSFAVRAAAVVGKKDALASSGIATQPRSPKASKRAPEWWPRGRALRGRCSPYEKLNVRFEAYIGRNQANMGMLALGQGESRCRCRRVRGLPLRSPGPRETTCRLRHGGLRPDHECERHCAVVLTRLADVGAGAWRHGARNAVELGCAPRLRIHTGQGRRLHRGGFVYQSRHNLLRAIRANSRALQIAPGVEIGVVYSF